MLKSLTASEKVLEHACLICLTVNPNPMKFCSRSLAKGRICNSVQNFCDKLEQNITISNTNWILLILLQKLKNIVKNSVTKKSRNEVNWSRPATCLVQIKFLVYAVQLPLVWDSRLMLIYFGAEMTLQVHICLSKNQLSIHILQAPTK